MLTHFKKKPYKQKTWQCFLFIWLMILTHILEKFKLIMLRFHTPTIDSDLYMTHRKLKLKSQKIFKLNPHVPKFDIYDIDQPLTIELDKISTNNWQDLREKFIETAQTLIPLEKRKHP